MSIVLVATISPAPAAYDDVVAAVRAVIPAVHAEPGCELYALHEWDGQLVIIEKWTSAETLAAHSSGAALAQLGKAFDGKLAGRPDVRTMAPLPVGDSQRGAL
jgi:quinol monooxygenase YgiN